MGILMASRSRSLDSFPSIAISQGERRQRSFTTILRTFVAKIGLGNQELRPNQLAVPSGPKSWEETFDSVVAEQLQNGADDFDDDAELSEELLSLIKMGKRSQDINHETVQLDDEVRIGDEKMTNDCVGA